LVGKLRDRHEKMIKKMKFKDLQNLQTVENMQHIFSKTIKQCVGFNQMSYNWMGNIQVLTPFYRNNQIYWQESCLNRNMDYDFNDIG
jgi:hypothetical protein